MNFKFNLSMLSISDLALVKKVSGSFACKTVVSYCVDSVIDINQIERLHLNDENLIINKYPCNTHNLFNHLNIVTWPQKCYTINQLNDYQYK